MPEFLIPPSFKITIGFLLIVIALLLLFITIFYRDKNVMLKIFGLLLVSAFSLFADNHWIYFVAIFIIATTVTELSFLQNLAAIFRGDKYYFDYMKAATQGQTTKESAVAAEKSKLQRTLMEYMILNTLWTKQINKWPDLSSFFTFKMNFPTSSETQNFREAAAKLVGEGLITETLEGQYLLTINGFDYCKKHYLEFPSEQWWPEEKINKDNLEKVLNRYA